MNLCLCGHPRYEHSIFHEGRCTAAHTEPVIVGTALVGWSRQPCTCLEYEEDDGTDGNLRLRPPIVGKPKGA